MKNNLYSVLIPCYKSTIALENVVKLVKSEFEKNNIKQYEIILVNDGSPDGGNTTKLLQRLNSQYQRVQVIELCKNVGQHNAVLCGLNYAKGEFIIALDDDMQTHPEEIIKLLEELNEEIDIVYGVYLNKKHSLFRNFCSRVNHLTAKILIGKPDGVRTSSFWVIRRSICESVIRYTGKDCYLPGLFLRTTDRVKSVPVKHYERIEGNSNYNLKSLSRLYLKMLTFSIVPIKLVMAMGSITSVMGLIMTITTIINKINNPLVPLGYASIMSSIYLFSGCILFCVGILGEYMMKILIYQNGHPQYTVREIREGYVYDQEK